MVIDDPWGGFVLAFVFLIIGFAFRFKPGWISKHSFGRHGIKLATGFMPNKRIIIIMKFIGLAFLLMGLVALFLSFEAMN